MKKIFTLVVAAMATLTVSAQSDGFKHYPVIEEFTGTGCGWCPRGWAGMEHIRQEFGEDAIGIALHQYNSSDAMYIAATKYAKHGMNGAPSCKIDRSTETDPFYGNGNSSLGIFTVINNAKANTAPVGVEVKGVFDEAKDSVFATATAQCMNANEEYMIEYVLVADSLRVPSNATASEKGKWKQSNYYTSYTAAQAGATGTLLAKFCKNGEWCKSSVEGMYFNDVAIASSYKSSKNQASNIVFGEAYTPIESTFALAMPTTKTLINSIKEADYNVYVIAIVINKSTKKVVNAAKAKVQAADETTGVKEVANATEVVEVARYNAAGQLINEAQKGINIIKLSNGKTVKVLVK